MKYFPLIWSGLWRNPTRTTLSALSVIAAFLVLGLLQNVTAFFAGLVSTQRDDRVHVHPKQGMWLPFSYLQQIKAVPGILAITYDIPPGGYFREPKNRFGVFWTDPEKLFIVYPDFHVASAYLDAMKTTRDGILVSVKLAEKYGWRIGDRVPIGSQNNLRTDGTEIWPFEIVGTFEVGTSRPFGCCVIENYPYFSDSSAANKGQVGEFIIRVKDARQSAQIATAIDKLFENSPAETQTDLERDNSFVRGSPISLVMRSGTIAGFAIILIVMTVTTLQSLRERTREFGLLKAVGFANAHIQIFVVAESVVLTLTAALVGFGSAVLYSRFVMPPPFGGDVRMATVTWGLAAALAVAAAGSFIPVWRASRLDAAKILARV